MSKILGLFVVAICLALGLGQPASAQPAGAIALAGPIVGGSYGILNFDGLTITAIGCTYNDGGAGASDCVAADDLYMVPTASRGTVNVTIEAWDGNTPVPPVLSCGPITSCSGGYDLDVDLTVVTNDSSNTLTGASAALAGSASPGLASDVTGTETIQDVYLDTLCTLNVNLATSPSPVCGTFAGQNYLSVSKDFALSLNGVTNGSALQLTSLTESFTRAPEPASIASLLAGIVGLAAMRRKRRRV